MIEPRASFSSFLLCPRLRGGPFLPAYLTDLLRNLATHKNHAGAGARESRWPTWPSSRCKRRLFLSLAPGWALRGAHPPARDCHVGALRSPPRNDRMGVVCRVTSRRSARNIVTGGGFGSQHLLCRSGVRFLASRKCPQETAVLFRREQRRSSSRHQPGSRRNALRDASCPLEAPAPDTLPVKYHS